MSLVAISGNASGTGTLTIAAPNTNSNYTLTLPTLTGTVLTNATAGTVLQVVTASTTTSTNTASTSAIDSTLTATITPSSSTSKILVMVNQSVGKQTAATSSTSVTLVRGSTTIATISAYSLYTGVTTPIYGVSVSNNYLDSPATTSATTYKTQFFCGTASGDAMAQPNNSLSTITLMEIAA